MNVKLIVLKGPHAGAGLSVRKPECLIGRGAECHIRPKSDVVSRQHCAILTVEGEVIVRDLASRNGTFVNDIRIWEDRRLATGDKLQIGPLAFEVSIDYRLGGERRPQTHGVRGVAVRTTASGEATEPIDEGQIVEWIDQADRRARRRRRRHPETRQMKLDETNQVSLQQQVERRAEQAKRRRLEEETAEQEAEGQQGPGKLPKRVEPPAKDSSEAADRTLREYFNSR